MAYYYSRVETLPAITRALEELRSLQKRRLKAKMTSIANIGDGRATALYGKFSNTDTGTITIERIGDYFQVAIRSDGKTHMVLPCDQIKSYSIVNKIVTLQLEEHYMWEKFILGFHSEEQVQMFKTEMPPVKRPEDHNNTEDSSSSTDFDDSGREKSKVIKDNSFNSDNPSDESAGEQ